MSAPLPQSQQADAAVVAAYQQHTDQLRTRLVDTLLTLWVALGVYRAAEMATFVRQAVPLVAAAQRQMASLTTGYLNAYRTVVAGRSRSVRVNLADVTGAAARNGVDPAEVYGRPFHLVWRQLAELPREPGAIEQAIQAGGKRVEQLAKTDLQLTKVQTSKRVLADDPKVVGYRRVLEGAHSCGLCIVAATLRYHKARLLPIHGGCDCGVVPIIGDVDPGKTIEAAHMDEAGNVQIVGELGDVHAAIAERFGQSSSAARLIPGEKGLQYRDVLVTHTHGELGSVLGVRGADFTGRSDLTK